MQRLQRWPLCHCALCFGNLVFSSWLWLWQPQIHITLGIFRGCKLWDPVCIVWLQPRHVFNCFESTKSQSTSSQIFTKLSSPRLVKVAIKPFHCVVLAALSFWPKPKDTKGLENLKIWIWAREALNLCQYPVVLTVLKLDGSMISLSSPSACAGEDHE